MKSASYVRERVCSLSSDSRQVAAVRRLLALILKLGIGSTQDAFNVLYGYEPEDGRRDSRRWGQFGPR